MFKSLISLISMEGIASLGFKMTSDSFLKAGMFIACLIENLDNFNISTAKSNETRKFNIKIVSLYDDKVIIYNLISQ